MLNRIGEHQVRYTSPPACALAFAATPEWVGTHANLQESEDDLGRYEAAYFDIDGTNLTVMRHSGNPQDTFSIMVDVAHAKTRHQEPMQLARQILNEVLKLSDACISRENPSMQVER